MIDHHRPANPLSGSGSASRRGGSDLVQPVAPGTLQLLTGPMFAGKSSALIAHAHAAAEMGRGVLVLKPAFDDRDGATLLSSRDGSRADALPVSRWPAEASGRDLLVIDEVQFMAPPHYRGDIVRDLLRAVENGAAAVVGGLDTDYRRQPFEPVARLARRATVHRRLFARCHRCGAPAAWTAKRTETGLRLELGSEGLYEARCDRHWSLPEAAATVAWPGAAAPAPDASLAALPVGGGGGGPGR